jgi:hypothetical protein
MQGKNPEENASGLAPAAKAGRRTRVARPCQGIAGTGSMRRIGNGSAPHAIFGAARWGTVSYAPHPVRFVRMITGKVSPVTAFAIWPQTGQLVAADMRAKLR